MACPTLSSAVNGAPIVYSGENFTDVSTGNLVIVGGTAEFDCVPGYTISPISTLSCADNGTWSAATPVCIGKSKVLTKSVDFYEIIF